MDKNSALIKSEKARKKRLCFAIVGVCVVIPTIIALSFLFLDNSKYLISSILVLIVAMLPFFLVFENRKPKAREVVLIVVMCAIVILGQMLFHVTIPIQAGTALVVISGASLGPEAGFLVGALSRFVLNFYLGQGPWTPWEMFCWGILGFFAGIAFNKSRHVSKKEISDCAKPVEKEISKSFKFVLGPIVGMLFGILIAYIVFLFDFGNDESFFGWRIYVFGGVGLILGALIQRKRLPADRITLTVFTLFTTFVFYGGIMNVCAMVTSTGLPGSGPISWDTLRALYITGFPFDLWHAITASIFIFFFGSVIIRKIDRIKIKYGIYKK